MMKECLYCGESYSTINEDNLFCCRNHRRAFRRNIFDNIHKLNDYHLLSLNITVDQWIKNMEYFKDG